MTESDPTGLGPPPEPTLPPPPVAAPLPVDATPPAAAPLPPMPQWAEPQRLHRASPVLDLITSMRQWLFPLLILIFSSGRSLLFGPIALVGLALIVGWKIVAWTRFTYWLHDDVLTIQHGVFQRNKREVPVSRIQQVDLRRRLRHRMLGVAVVRIDTAGGGSKAEIVLEAIADDEANALRYALLGRTAGRSSLSVAGATPAGTADPAVPDGTDPIGNGPTADAPVPTVDVVRLSVRQLVIAGITGSRLLAALPIVAAGVGLLFELPQETSEDVIGLIPTGAIAFIVFAVAVVPVLLISAVAASLLTDFEYALVRVGSDLHLRRGLLDQREVTISLHRIQVVRIHENLLRRKLGLASVQLQSAGSGGQAESEVTRLTIPYVRRADLTYLLGELLPIAAHHPPLVAAPPAARRRALFRHLAPSLLVLGGLALMWSIFWTGWAGFLVLFVIPFGIHAELMYRNLGYVGTPQLVVARSGGLVRETALVPVAKTQSTRLSTSPFQKRLGLATLHIDVAGRGGVPQITDGDADDLARLRFSALHASAARADEDAVRRRARAEVVAAEPA